MMTIKKDNYYEICNTFKEWLAQNEHRFHLKCKIRHYPAKRKLNIYFENVAPEIFCTVQLFPVPLLKHFYFSLSPLMDLSIS
jgi:hypothetical protein